MHRCCHHDQSQPDGQSSVPKLQVRAANVITFSRWAVCATPVNDASTVLSLRIIARQSGPIAYVCFYGRR